MTVTSGDRRLTLAAGAHWQVVPLPRVATSAGRTYRFTLRRTARQLTQDVALAAWLDNPLRNGFSASEVRTASDLRFEARKGTRSQAVQADVISPRPLSMHVDLIALVVLPNVLLVAFAAGFVHGDAANGAAYARPATPFAGFTIPPSRLR
jgi:hypothetical protein